MCVNGLPPPTLRRTCHRSPRCTHKDTEAWGSGPTVQDYHTAPRARVRAQGEFKAIVNSYALRKAAVKSCKVPR